MRHRRRPREVSSVAPVAAPPWKDRPCRLAKGWERSPEVQRESRRSPNPEFAITLRASGKSIASSRWLLPPERRLRPTSSHPGSPPRLLMSERPAPQLANHRRPAQLESRRPRRLVNRRSAKAVTHIACDFLPSALALWTYRCRECPAVPTPRHRRKRRRRPMPRAEESNAAAQ